MEVRTTPALPWDSETEGANIKLNPSHTQEEIESGFLKIIARKQEEGALVSNFYCYFNFLDEYLTASAPLEDEIADISVITEDGKIAKINISNINEAFEILSIEKNEGETSLLPVSGLPVTGGTDISCSKGLTFDDVLAHVKLKFSGDNDFVAAQQRDQYGCEWVSSSNTAKRFSTSRNDNIAVPYIELATTTSATLVAIKYE